MVSALGGITDQLLLTARLAAAGDEAYMPQCTAMIARHNELVEKIVLPETGREFKTGWMNCWTN